MVSDAHLVLVSEQVTPNITPALDPEFRPQELILLVSDAMLKRADWLEAVLKTTGVKVSRWPVGDPWDIEHIRERMLELLGARAGQRIALNVTGGTKPMSIAAYEVFREFDRPIFYVHPDKDRVIWMHPHERPPHELANRIKLPAFLQAHGNYVVAEGDRHGVPENLRRLTNSLVEKVEKYARPLSILNWAAASAEKTLKSREIDRRNFQRQDFTDLVAWFEHENLLSVNGNRLCFPDEQARFFVNGGWLETHVYYTVLDLKKSAGIQDIRRSIEISGEPGGPVSNELDVAFLAENRLYLIECKTKRFKNTGSPDADGAHAIYKLDTLTDFLGGLKAKGMLVSYQLLGAHDRERAEGYKIRVCDAVGIKNLRNTLLEWIS